MMPAVYDKGTPILSRGDIQKFRCNHCKHYFTINLRFERMHSTPQMIPSAVQLYLTGESFRNVKRFLELKGVKMSHISIYNGLENMSD